jgi:hypothetical protein
LNGVTGFARSMVSGVVKVEVWCVYVYVVVC